MTAFEADVRPMPLRDTGTPQALRQNIATEVKAKEAQGYPPKKAAQIASAIGYSVQRKAKARKRHA